MTNSLKAQGLIPGISGYVSAPYTYQVDYFNGSQIYTERFAVINIGSQYTGAASKQIDIIIAEVSAALAASAGAATGGLGVALGPLASLALHWIKDQIFNADGSITLMLAYHSIGTKNIGVDPTFVPGGLDPYYWNGIVNSVSSALSKFGSKHENVLSLDYKPVQKTNGNFSEVSINAGSNK
jgi:hypothetical protein